MIELIFLFVGFYVGGGFVTSVVVHTVDGKEATWKESFVMAAIWPYVLMTAGEPEDE